MPAKRPIGGIYKLSNVRDTGRLIHYRCGICHRASYYDPADLIAVFGDGDIERPPFRCSGCGRNDSIDVGLHQPSAGDYGRLQIRRPGKIRTIQTWRTVVLGERAG